MDKYKVWIIIGVVALIILGLIFAKVVLSEELVCQTTFPPGTKVTLTAKACPGSVFTGWSRDCAFAGKSKTCTLTMNGIKTAGANFKKLPVPRNLRMSEMEKLLNAGSIEMYESCYLERKPGLLTNSIERKM